MDIGNHRFVSLKCSVCGFLYDVPLSCGDRLCPVCNRRRYGVLINRYQEFFKSLPPGACRFVTLTLKNDSDLAAMHEKLVVCVHKLIEYGKKHWGWQGGVFAYQATNKGKGWHDHAHLIVQGGNYVPQEELSKVWQSITFDSFVVGIRWVLSPIDDLAYLLGYTLSVDGVLDCFREEYNRVFKGRRLLQSWGTWFNRMAAKEDVGDSEFVCPNCGVETWLCDDGHWISNFSQGFFTEGARPLIVSPGLSP